ncbi:MAG: peptidylprolyl isomerase [Deltaproteobacteria bacterium]|nr:peptidylprolyl isomerase [Deltaproteobacteria bacterium]
MRRSFLMAIPLLVLFLAAGPISVAFAKEEAVATVNGVIIPQSDLLRMMVNIQMTAQQEGRRLSQAEVVSWRKKVLDQLIGYELLYQEAKKAKLSVDPKLIDQYIAKARSGFPSDVEFKRALSRKQLSEEILRREIERDKLVEKYLAEKFLKTATPTEETIKKYYDAHPERWSEMRARHILVAFDAKAPATKAAARKKIDEILAKLKKGADFASMARQNSSCPSRERGGDLDFFARGQMVPEFSQAAFALAPGQLSPVVETKFGFHVIKAEEKRTISYNQAKDQIRGELLGQSMEELADRHVADLRRKARITILLDDSGKPSAKK